MARIRVIFTSPWPGPALAGRTESKSSEDEAGQTRDDPDGGEGRGPRGLPCGLRLGGLERRDARVEIGQLGGELTVGRVSGRELDAPGIGDVAEGLVRRREGLVDVLPGDGAGEVEGVGTRPGRREGRAVLALRSVGRPEGGPQRQRLTLLTIEHRRDAQAVAEIGYRLAGCVGEEELHGVAEPGV